MRSHLPGGLASPAEPHQREAAIIQGTWSHSESLGVKMLKTEGAKAQTQMTSLQPISLSALEELEGKNGGHQGTLPSLCAGHGGGFQKALLTCSPLLSDF